MLSCKDVLEKSSDYVDGEMSLWGKLQMWFHLLMCKYCRTFVRQFRVSTECVDHQHEQPADDTSVDAILDKLDLKDKK